MRGPVAIVVAPLILVAACSTSDARVPGNVLRSGEVRVTVNVTGDVSIGPSRYGVKLDTGDSVELRPNVSAATVLAEGDHLIEFLGPEPARFVVMGIPAPPEPSWCSAPTEKKPKVHVTSGITSSVEYSVNCPPLVGTGKLLVTVETTGGGTPTGTRLDVSREVGSSYVASRIIETNRRTEFVLPVGVYSFALTADSCRLPARVYVLGQRFGFPQQLVRQGQIVETRLSLHCP